jgi:hypothetical protein
MPTSSFESGTQMMREINSRTVNIEGLEPAVVIAALLNARRGDGLCVPGRDTPETVKKSFAAYRRTSLQGAASMWDKDFLHSLGMDLRLTLDGKFIGTFFYDEAYGDGLGSIVVDHVRCTKGDERWRTSHLINYARPASMLSIVAVIGLIAAFITLVLMMK